MLYLNNQSVNTYSHLVGALAFLLLPFYFYHEIWPTQANGQWEDVLIVGVYCWGVAVCFTFSTMYVFYKNHERKKQSTRVFLF